MWRTITIVCYTPDYFHEITVQFAMLGSCINPSSHRFTDRELLFLSDKRKLRLWLEIIIVHDVSILWCCWKETDPKNMCAPMWFGWIWCTITLMWTLLYSAAVSFRKNLHGWPYKNMDSGQFHVFLKLPWVCMYACMYDGSMFPVQFFLLNCSLFLQEWRVEQHDDLDREIRVTHDMFQAKYTRHRCKDNKFKSSFFFMDIGAVMSRHALVHNRWLQPLGGTYRYKSVFVTCVGPLRIPFFLNAAKAMTWYQWYNVNNIRYSKLPLVHTLMSARARARARALICTRGTALKPQQAQHNATRTNGVYRIKEYRPPSTHIISRFAVRPILPIWTTSPSHPFSSPLQFPAAVYPSSISR